MESKSNNDNMFNVPCVVVDNFLQMATGEYIKVLLYILRDSGRDFAENEISEETGVSCEEVTKAIDFWRRAKILTSSNTGGDTQQAQQTAGESVPENSSGQKKKYKKSYFSASDIAEIKTSDLEMSELIDAAENLLGILNNSQLALIIQMHYYLGLEREVIMTLIEYCKEIGKTYPQYMEAIAYSWSENNINTLESAQQEAQRLLAKDNYTSKVKRITRGSAFSKNDETFIEKWRSMNVPLQLVEEAYDVTAGSIHKLSFSYMDKVIMSRLAGGSEAESRKPAYNNRNRNTGRRRIHHDDDFDVDMYKIFINDFEVI